MILSGIIATKKTLKGKIIPEASLKGVLVPKMVLTGIINISDNFPLYDGSYEITPKIDAQELLTDERGMKQNIIVKGIPYAEVTNQFGGKTVTIGG